MEFYFLSFCLVFSNVLADEFTDEKYVGSEVETINDAYTNLTEEEAINKKNELEKDDPDYKVTVIIKSYTVKVGSTISVKEKSLNHPAMKQALENTLNRPAYVEFDDKKMTGTYLRLPERSELNADINESLIVEYYNR